jgi:hypothetical protein
VTTRVRGGTAGILAAIASGRLDPLDARLPEERELHGLSGSERRALIRRQRRRERKDANRLPF